MRSVRPGRQGVLTGRVGTKFRTRYSVKGVKYTTQRVKEVQTSFKWTDTPDGGEGAVTLCPLGNGE